MFYLIESLQYDIPLPFCLSFWRGRVGVGGKLNIQYFNSRHLYQEKLCNIAHLDVRPTSILHSLHWSQVACLAHTGTSFPSVTGCCTQPPHQRIGKQRGGICAGTGAKRPCKAEVRPRDYFLEWRVIDEHSAASR